MIAGCTGERTGAPDGVEAELTISESEPALGVLPAEQEQLLERRADGAALFGTVEAAPLNGDPERVMVLRTEHHGTSFDPALDGSRVLDARFVLDVVVTLGTDHVLRAHAGGTSTVLDADVEGPLTVRGARVAYGRGEMPFFELAWVDVNTATVEILTRDMAPIWSPALSPEGSEIVFVSSASGRPMLYWWTPNGDVLPLETTARFPTSPRAPRWEGTTLSFEDERGATSIELAEALR